MKEGKVLPYDPMESLHTRDPRKIKSWQNAQAGWAIDNIIFGYPSRPMLNNLRQMEKDGGKQASVVKSEAKRLVIRAFGGRAYEVYDTYQEAVAIGIHFSDPGRLERTQTRKPDLTAEYDARDTEQDHKAH